MNRVKHGPHLRNAINEQPDRHSKKGILMGVVGRAIQGIDCPEILTIQATQRSRLFGQNGVIRHMATQNLDHGGFCGFVCLGDQIARATFFLNVFELAPMGLQNGSGG